VSDPEGEKELRQREQSVPDSLGVDLQFNPVLQLEMPDGS
jgi:hypothetical protein